MRTTRMLLGRVALTLALALVLAACGGTADTGGAPPADDGGSDGDGSGDGGSDDDPAGDGDVGAIDPSLDAEVAAALALVGDDGATVTLAERVTWPDGSLGCPEPDVMYTQALVEGYRILVTSGGGEVALHGEDGGEPFVCEEPTPPVG